MAVALAGAVKDGSVSSLDDLANKYVPWWTKNKSDPRSRVTLRHLLSFTSGFGNDEEGQEAPATVHCINNASLTDFDGCARAVYDGIGGAGGVNMTGEPGTVFCYNSYQLQLAGAIVTRATGLKIQQVIDKYLLKPYNMSSTFCSGSNPQLAVCMITTGRDYANFLSNLLRYEALGKELGLETERDYTPFMASYPTLYGDYGFGHYLYCFDSVVGRSKACIDARVHADPGGFGFFPLIDRRYDYYMELVAFEHTTVTYPRSGIPEYLMQAMKPIVDAIMRGEGVASTAGHATPEFMGLTLADVNYISLCYLYPSYCGAGIGKLAQQQKTK
jgi:CubicO group peptidase (beta-lactamase class C family)